MNSKKQKNVTKIEEVKKDEIKTPVEQSYESGNGIKDYKFTIVLLAIIAIAAFSIPFVSKGIQSLKESGFIDDLFSKGNKSTDNKDKNEEKPNDKLEIVNADKSGANSPVLKDGMIPVRYNYIKNKWVKADSENPSTNSWYNYSNSEWANAILVRKNGIKTREYYESANPDTIINDEDILAFYVWIPRYKYSMTASTGVQQIDIDFEEKTAAKTSGPNFITHPAFTYDGEELDGIWVGKFEVTSTLDYLTVLPNYPAVVNQNIASMFNAIKGFYGDGYGLNDNANLRLLKNSEWGAITYLANSKYGICKDNKCSTIENYNFDYSTDVGVKSSTTGNITGVYAMNGGVMEYVMGNNNSLIGESGFDNVWMSENKKYYDVYTDGNANDYTRGIPGDATNEFGPFTDNKSNWNSSYAKFIDSNLPWFFRGVDGSIYSFSSYTGAGNSQVGFRLSLS